MKFFYKNLLKHEATSTIKIEQTYSSFFSGSKKRVRVCLRNSLLTTKAGLKTLHSTERTHWVENLHRNCFDSYGAPPPEKLIEFIEKTQL